MFPFSLGFCLLGLFSLGDVSQGECVCVCIHYLYSLFVFYRKETLSASCLFFSLVQTQTTACFELSDFSGCKPPLHWLYGQPPRHTPETENNGYPQFIGGFTPILSMWVCTFTPRNGVDVGCPQLSCVCVIVCVYVFVCFCVCVCVCGCVCVCVCVCV